MKKEWKGIKKEIGRVNWMKENVKEKKDREKIEKKIKIIGSEKTER